jgi:hypothetical protein
VQDVVRGVWALIPECAMTIVVEIESHTPGPDLLFDSLASDLSNFFLLNLCSNSCKVCFGLTLPSCS